MSERETATHWIDGRVCDDEPRATTPWQRVISVLLLLWLFDFALGLRATPPDPAAHDLETAQLRATLTEAHALAQAGQRSLLLIGDSVLAGDSLARERPHDWDSQRVIDHLRRELDREAGRSVALQQVAFDGLLPTDALHLLAELDRIDPGGEVELVMELNLRFFSAQYAEQRDCTRPAICELGPLRLEREPPQQAWSGVVVAATRVREQLQAWTPVHRQREQLDVQPLDQLPGLAVARADEAEPELDDAEGLARVSEHYRSARIRNKHPQVKALAALLDRAAARKRKLSLFVTPLADGFARQTLGSERLGEHYAELARMVNNHDDPGLALLDLDHPLFVEAHFIDHVHLDPEGSRLLALNLLHELNLPLAKRPFEQEMVHPEGNDRTLVHRVDTGYAQGGAWQALFDRPQGVAVSRDGTRIVVADTHNHVLRELRGNMQFVETVAGQAGEPGRTDDRARVATLDHPRDPELLGDAVWFIDGARRDTLRVLADGVVHTPSLRGPTCARYQTLRARAHAIWALCSDNQLIRIDVEHQQTERVFDRAPNRLVSFDVATDTIYFADAGGRLWRRTLEHDPTGQPVLGPWDNFFANRGEALLPHGHRVGFPYSYEQLRLAKVVDLRFIDRYGGLLVADEFPLGKTSERLEKELTERVHLRYFDLDAERILPWIKTVPHGEAHALYNATAEQIVSYWHLGTMAIAQDDASLIWLEQRRSRLLRVADGLLGVAKSGNHHTRGIAIPLLQTVGGVSRGVEAQLRPDRHLDRRHEPLPRKGPYLALLCGSSLSSMSDRLSNYSLGRRLELELQRELGYRDLVRFDLFQISWAAASFGQSVNNLANWMKASVPPDVVFIEAHDLGGGRFVRDTKTREELVATFRQLRELADRYDTLVVFYDLSSIEGNGRESMRSTDKRTRELLQQAERLGFVVLDPGDRLLPELLRHSPWANQPFAENQHHGAPWAVDMTAATLAAMIYPTLREFFRDRVPARLRERPPSDFEQQRSRDPLRRALERVELDADELTQVDPGYVQTDFVDAQLRVYVDLAGFRDHGDTDLDALAVAVIHQVLREDIYADFAETLHLELVEFSNYDEYGNGVLDSATSKWKRELDRRALEQFLREHRPG